MDNHVNAVSKFFYYHLCVLWDTDLFVSEDMAKMVACALVSHLGYTNFVLYDSEKYLSFTQSLLGSF